MKKILFTFITLLFSINVFASIEQEVGKQVKGAVDCNNYGLWSDCYCHRAMYQKIINGKAKLDNGGGWNAARSEQILAKQRECMNSYNPHYSKYKEYQDKLEQIPMSLISAEESNKGNAQAQYLFNKETEAAFRDPKVNNTEKADEFLDKNIEILITNMMSKGWAAKNVMKHLYAGNLTTEQKEAALQTLNANLPNMDRCKSDICKVPGTVGDVAELFANCGEDTCLLTALQVELFNSLVQSGATSVATDEALNTLTAMLIKNVGDTQGKSKRFGDKQANATVKIPVLKAILELGDEDYYLKTTRKVLDKKTLSYSDRDTEVMSFIIESYSAMDKYDPIIEMAFNQTKNQVAMIEANIALANTDYPEILTEEEKQKIANVLHYSYADGTTACPTFVNETKIGGQPVLAGLINPTETDVMLKQRICDAYKKLNVKGERTDLPCYPCDGNLGVDISTMIGETLISFVLDDAADDLVFGALTFGVGTVATHMIKGPKYINKTRRLASKVKKAVSGGSKFTDKITAGVKVPKKARRSKKATSFTLQNSGKGKQVVKWRGTTTPEPNVGKSLTTPDVTKGGKKVPTDTPTKPVSSQIEEEAQHFGNQLGNTDVTGTTPKGTTQPTGQIGKNSVIDPNAMKQMPQSAGRPRNKTPQNKVKNPTKTVDNAADVKNGVNAAEDIAARIPAETVPELPKKTALDPKGIKLTDEFDDLVASAKPEETRRGIGFKPQDNVSPTSTTSGAPEGTRRQIGFGKSDTYIPDDAGKAVNGKGGVQDFTKGNKGHQTRGPEGPNASKNPYDVRNQAGGTDAPGSQQQDLSGLNQQISNTPNQPTTLSEKEIRELAGNKNPRGHAAERWTKLNLEYEDVVKVEPIPGKGGARVTNSNGYTKEVSANSFKDWVNTDEFGIGLSPEKRKSIQGLDETFAFWDETKRLDKIFGKNMKLNDFVAIGPRSVRRSLNSGCSTFETCKQLADYLVDMRKFSQTNQSELLAKFAQSTGSNNVDDMYKSLSDFFHHTNEKEAYNWLQESVNDKGIMDFLFKNETVPDFSKLADNMLSKANTDDLAKILKSEVPDNFKSLQQVASADDWKVFVSNVRGQLEQRLAASTNLYNSSLDKAAEKAPELIADIRSGKKQIHRITLRKAVGKQTADDIVDSYREIEKLNKALK